MKNSTEILEAIFNLILEAIKNASGFQSKCNPHILTKLA